MMLGRFNALLSVIAILISGLTYYSSIKKEDRLIFRLVEGSLAEENGTVMSADLVFTNNGSVPYLISQIQLSVNYGVNGGSSYANDNYGLVSDLPFVLSKDEMRVVSIRIPIAEISAKNIKKCLWILLRI